MKRKKWSEVEEKTLLMKYSDLLRGGTLAKSKTREKKFKPIADLVNSLHHLPNPAAFPFRWTWRDVSVKIQNMRHQYLGVKLKIRIEPDRFDWDDGDNHWENFSLYREVFGDVEIEERESGSEEEEDEEEEMGMEVARMRVGVVKREERRREREEVREGKRRREIAAREVEPEEEADPDQDSDMKWHKREIDRTSRVEWEIRRRREAEERWEEEEMKWRERAMTMQLEHERQMMQMHAEACHNQIQIIGSMARIVSQFFVPAGDGLGGGGLGALSANQVLGGLQHDLGGLGGDGKPGSDSPSEFL